MYYSRSSLSSLPSEPGVYEFLGKDKKVLYVGKAKDLKSRVSSYFNSPAQLGAKTLALVDKIDSIRITIVESELEALLLEAFLIKKWRPYYNIRLTDDKSYQFIRITIKDDFPSVTLSRRDNDSNSIYFGPYPSSRSVKLVLKTIRKVFPFLSSTNHPKRICLYNHLNLCPCLPVNNSPENIKLYKKNIQGIVRILEGKSRIIQKELEKERDIASNNEEFEISFMLQKRINALKLITEPFHRPSEYDVNPNLRVDLREQEMLGLMELLNKKGYYLTSLNRIECYDISNIQGTHATASLVVLTNGEVDKSQYRKFKIKKDGKPNDFAMMEETLTRRLKHTDWPNPDLLIVDGGKGQITSALKAFKATGVYFPLIGLAKREETIITSDFTEILVPRSTGALQLIMRIRDEAHRFALTYHRKLRAKAMVSSLKTSNRERVWKE